MRCPTTKNSQLGIAAVETALTLPFLLMLLIASVEVTNIFVTHNTLTRTVRDGARYIAGEARNGAGVVNLRADQVADTQSLVVYGKTGGSGTPVLPGFTTADVTVTEVAPEIVQVSARYAYSGILGPSLPDFGFGPGASLSFNLDATVNLRAL